MTTTPTIGVVGGFGPDTTAEFCTQLLAQARLLQPDVSPAFVVDFVSVPTTTAARAIGGDSQAASSLVASINASLARLAKAGARTLVFPCNTMHVFASEFIVPTGCQFLHIVKQVAQELEQQKTKCIGLLATGLTVHSGLYNKLLSAHGILCHVPEDLVQAVLSTHIAHFHATGTVRPSAANCLQQALHHLQQAGAECAVLGCTDIGGMLRLSDIQSPLPCIDSVAVLAQASARACVA